jgi:hypothetical protein
VGPLVAVVARACWNLHTHTHTELTALLRTTTDPHGRGVLPLGRADRVRHRPRRQHARCWGMTQPPAAIDSGINFHHPDLKDNMHPLLGYDAESDCQGAAVMDTEGHGTLRR